MIHPATLLLTLADHDHRICFAFNITKNNFIYLSPAFDRFFQLPPDMATPKLLFSFVHAEDSGYIKSVYHSLEPGVLKDNLECRLILSDKKEYTVRFTLLLDFYEQEEKVLSGYLEDMTSVKANEEKGKELSNKKNAILNILSHDLAGPLGSIKNFAFLLSKKTKPLEDKEINKIISSIERISKRSIQMIQEFIKQEFVESVGVDLVKTRINLVEKIDKFMQEYFLSENETGKIFRFQTSHAQVYAEIDENKFMQVLNNLISNALKFTPDGGTITVNILENEQHILVTIADTGVGIPQKFHASLFDRFSEARRPGLKGEPSVGLGMSIIKTIVEWHQAKIWFESEEHKGTVFYIELPKAE